MTTPSIVFHVHLVQDVAALRPLARLARSIPGRSVSFLVSSALASLDPTGLWSGELDALCAELDVARQVYETELDAHRILAGRSGLIVAGSESNVRSHAETHRLFKSAPSNFTTVTLQHGFECVGFLHNAAHDATAGRAVRFAADVVVGWFPPERLHAMASSERAKLFVAGPSTLIEPAGPRPPAPGGFDQEAYEGMVCENLHSVRFRSAVMRTSFLDEFAAFEREVAAFGTRVHLRSHPAGRFTEKAAAALPSSVVRSKEPLYRLDLARYAFAISAPSSILFDFILAGVPVAVWAQTGIDVRNWDDLPRVATGAEWWRFAVAAASMREELVEAQDRFVDRLRIPPDVAGRYRSLLSMA